MNPPAISRHHTLVRGRGVHYRRTGVGPPVVLLHASPRSSAALLPLMTMAPADRTVLAFDTPGCGDSAPLRLGRPADVFDYGDALAETLSSLGIDRAAVHGSHTGAAIATALAIRHPERVAGLVLDGLSVFSAAEIAAWLGDYLPVFEPDVDGTHLTWLWSRVRDQQIFFPWNQRRSSARLRQPLPTATELQAVAIDVLRAGDHHRAPYEAAFRFDPPRWLAQLRMPLFVGARPDDVLVGHLDRLPGQPPALRTEVLPADTAGWGARLWQELSEASAALPPAASQMPAALPDDGIGSAFVGAAGAQQLHLLGSSGGTGRPLVLLHDSPGGARGLEAELGALLGTRPVIAPDWPAHGDSHGWHGAAASPEALAVVLDAAWRALGIDEADVHGSGVGSRIAAACASCWPTRYRSAAARAPHPTTIAAPSLAVPRDDGGHLQAAWLYARDDAIFGPAWTRDPSRVHDFGESLDIAAIHRQCVEALKEAPEAAGMRAALLRGAVHR